MEVNLSFFNDLFSNGIPHVRFPTPGYRRLPVGGGDPGYPGTGYPSFRPPLEISSYPGYPGTWVIPGLPGVPGYPVPGTRVPAIPNNALSPPFQAAERPGLRTETG
eukprot:1628663-Rhodomonas_salina.1